MAFPEDLQEALGPDKPSVDDLRWRAVYPGHALTVAFCIMLVFENPAAALKPTKWGWAEAVGCSEVPGAGDGAHAGTRLVAKIRDGMSLDEAIAWADEEWESRVGPRSGNHVDQWEPGQRQANGLKDRFRIFAAEWFKEEAG